MKHYAWLLIAALSLLATPVHAEGEDMPPVSTLEEVKPDSKLAALLRAAKEGDARAQVKLGIMHHEGEGVLQNFKEAVKWLRLAAGQGDAEGQFLLGERYRNGEGLPKDYVRAHVMFNLAATRGNKEAVESRAAITKRMTSTQLEEAQELAQKWKPNQEETKESDTKTQAD
ncbi:MAG: sel1 repeat family protein [Magnetococcus sp. YQC-3]